MPGKFITLEGIDGAGKTTHAAWLADWLRYRGIDVRLTREPGGTALGEKLRAILLDRDQSMHLETEALLMFAARREHLATVILPALEDGKWVICDRFTDASFAYQGNGRGLNWSKLETLERWVQGPLQPDLTLLFDIAPELGRQRAGRIKVPDRFEQEQPDFYERVREGYLKRAKAAPARVHVIDAGSSIEHIQNEIANIVGALCR